MLQTLGELIKLICYGMQYYWRLFLNDYEIVKTGAIQSLKETLILHKSYGTIHSLV